MTESTSPSNEHERACRTCGCTDLRACMTAEGNCYWVEDDLCSACVGKAGVCTFTLTFNAGGAKLVSDGLMPAAAANRVLIIEGITSEMSNAAGEDPDQAVMLLLIAAAHMAKNNSGGRSWFEVVHVIQRNMVAAGETAQTWYDAMDQEKVN